MNQNTFRPILLIFFLIPFFNHLHAQDPFFTHFYNNESEFNPALTGIKGALSISTKYKSQWAGNGVPAFRSGIISVDESMPCSIFDYGFSFKFDEEGPGVFRTYDFGFKFAGTVAWKAGATVHNFRLGAALRWAYKTIDFSRFVFSDEIDPKYGLVDASGASLPTAFVPPSEGRSHLFFAPAVGAAYHFLSNEKSKKPTRVLTGLAIQNFYSFGSDRYGNEESILQLGTKIPVRYTGFLMLETVVYNSRNTFLSLRPSVLYQRQGEISYTETGLQFGINRLLSTGVYYHFSKQPEAGNNSNWLSFAVEVGDIIRTNKTKHRLDLGFAYANNFTGLKNTVGPILEVSLSYHFNTYTTCKLIGKNVDSFNKEPICILFLNEKKKMYDNIWY